MAYITGLILIDAPASALNNGQGKDNVGKVKSISVQGQGSFPYASAQSFRYWLRSSAEKLYPNDWIPSPVYVPKAGKQQAYTKCDPITHIDDDLLGYARLLKEDNSVTRVSPFRVSTFVSIAPTSIVKDFGVMARAPKMDDKEGVILHEHEFYRATLKGLFSFDLSSVGTFVKQEKPGYKQLDDETTKRAQEYCEKRIGKDRNGREYEIYRLPIEERIVRVQMLLRTLARIEGGAKQALHYTDVTPAFVIAAITKGGNHIFGRIIATEESYPVINQAALKQARNAFGDDILSPIYVGRVEGFMDNSHYFLEEFFSGSILHPRQALDALADDLVSHPEWLE